MNKNNIKRILMSLRNSNNENQVNNLLGKIDLLSEELVQQMIAQIGEDEEKIKKYFEKKIEEYVKDNSNHIFYYENAENDKRESRTFSQIKAAIEKVLELLEENHLTIYLTGGTVPYILLNQDSNRLHDDVDTVCKLEDVEKLRELFKKEGLYIPDWDSKNHSVDGKDYGFEIKIDGVPFGIYPFEYNNGTVKQYSFDPYNKRCKVKIIPVEQIEDYIQTYESRNGKMYNATSLEYIKLTKDNTGRPKDIADSIKISEYGIREDVMARIKRHKAIKDKTVR